MEPALEPAVHISLAAEKLFSIGNFPVTNALLMSLAAFVVLAGTALLLRRKIALVPGKVQSIFELALEELLSLMDSVLGTREKSERYLPLIATIFFFVITSNWLGLLPGVGSLIWKEGGENIPLLRSGAADLNFTLALGVIAVVGINLFGILAIGIKSHAGKFFNVKGPIDFFVGILEFISEFAKIVSFSFRLFGNVFAGEVLLTIVAFLVPYVIPLPFLFLEIFVGFIQAFVFSMLALVFVAIATTEHDAHEGTEHAH
jgi:F-type H+-transporting ATPase subunit a